MIRTLFTVAAVTAMMPCFAQNLVPNAGFEDYGVCPGGHSQAAHEFKVNHWRAASRGTPDYFNACSNGEAKVPHNWAGVSEAYEGQGYAGIFLWMDRDRVYREYLQCNLLSPMLKDSLYTVEFHYKLSSYSKFAADRIGLLLTDSMVGRRDDNVLALVPTLSVVHETPLTKETGLWETARMTYKASGGEQYLTIGNFFDNEATRRYEIQFRPIAQEMLARSAYYYIDDVKVVSAYADEYLLAARLPAFSPADVTLNTTYVLKDLQFELNSYKLMYTSFAVLDALAEYLIKNQAIKVQFFGHTDDQGSEQYNLRLSRNRAQTAAGYLASTGIPTHRMEIYGYGETKPLVPETTEVARTVNRRVEIRFIK